MKTVIEENATKKIRILGYNDSNNGSCLLSWTISQLLSNYFSEYDVKLLDYAPFNRRLLEMLRIFRPYVGNPVFNLKRYSVISKWIRKTLPIESFYPFSITEYIQNQKFDVVVVAKPSWDITNEWSLRGFPTAFWLPQDLPSRKVAFGVSAHRSVPSLVNRHNNEIRKILDSFSLIGVRDDWTYEIVSSSKTHAPIWKIPDPVFMYEFIETDIDSVLQERGFDLERPIVAFAAFGRNEIFRELANYFRRIDYQILGLSMFNPYVDANLGDVLDPFQWADIFRRLSFCVTDRYHASIMSLLVNIPFVGIEPYQVADRRNSKIYDLLKSIRQTDCYADIYGNDFQIKELIEKIEYLRTNWKGSYTNSVQGSLHEKKSEIKLFINRMQEIVR